MDICVLLSTLDGCIDTPKEKENRIYGGKKKKNKKKLEVGGGTKPHWIIFSCLWLPHIYQTLLYRHITLC